MGGDWKELMYAIEKDDLSLVRYHLANGVDPNYQHPEFLTSPLIESMRWERVDIANLLLEKGANPNLVEAFGKDTPLSIAIEKQNGKAISVLRAFDVDETRLPRGKRQQLQRIVQGKDARPWWKIW
ncbi:MAG: ankyrin repeat domain-containing protein [Bacteroidota bacterium]